MSPAVWPRADALKERLLLIDRTRREFSDARVGDLAAHVRDGDVLVVNDAATLPASLLAAGPRQEELELRLVARRGDGNWNAVLFGAGNWRTPTEHRPPPPLIQPGEQITLGYGLVATVWSLSTVSTRLIEIAFNLECAALWQALYAQGKPIQYAYLKGPLDLWLVQNVYAARPWAVEQPSAGRPLTWKLLTELQARGVKLAFLTHAAGLSLTGDAALDASLPLPESYDIPQASIDVIENARANGGRIIAVGTSVVRALEGCMRTHGKLVAGEGETDLLIGPGFAPRVVQGLLTGMHEKSATHFALLAAFADKALLDEAYGFAEQAGYLGHEFGDSNLIL